MSSAAGCEDPCHKTSSASLMAAWSASSMACCSAVLLPAFGRLEVAKAGLLVAQPPVGLSVLLLVGLELCPSPAAAAEAAAAATSVKLEARLQAVGWISEANSWWNSPT